MSLYLKVLYNNQIKFININGEFTATAVSGGCLMKKIAGILICIALAFTLAGCSWKIPETVSVKTNADYNFSLGNFEKDFSENLSVSKMIGDLQLPNNGKVYDYWPNKKGDTQSFLMYMPLQEIPIDIGSYFDKGSLADSIKNISFEKEIEVPEVSFSFPVEFNLDDVNKEINKQFVLAGPIQNYDASEFGAILKEVADSITYEKGVLVVTAYEVNLEDIAKLNAGTATIQSIANNIATSYYGSVSITSGDQAPLSGYFNNGKAELVIPSNGFDFISDDININFTNIPSPSDYGYKPLVFIAKIDTDREYQIKKVSGIGNTISIPSVSFNQKIDSLEALKDSGVEECTIGEGSIDLDFDIPSEWKNVAITYGITMTGGIEATSGSCTASSSSSNNVGSIDLDGKSIKAEEINVSAAVTLTVAGATIDFTKPPAISFDSNISRIKTVTVKLSDTSLSVADSQVLPDEVLDFISEIELRQCGIEGTYTNTLPEGNEITLTVSSDFFGLNLNALCNEDGTPLDGKQYVFLRPKHWPLTQMKVETNQGELVKATFYVCDLEREQLYELLLILENIFSGGYLGSIEDIKEKFNPYIDQVFSFDGIKDGYKIVFNQWTLLDVTIKIRKIGTKVQRPRNYPRIVAKTLPKSFVGIDFETQMWQCVNLDSWLNRGNGEGCEDI